MKKVIIFHGTAIAAEYYNPNFPSLSNSHWLPWLQKQLLIVDIEAHTPEVYKAHEPEYGKWLAELERYRIDKNTILVGHSCGAGFLVRWLSENKDVFAGKVILVAPWLNPGHMSKTDMFDFEIDPGLSARTNKLKMFYSTDDMQTIQKSVQLIKDRCKNIEFKEFQHHGHFTYGDMGTKEFPELLKEIIT